MSAIRIIVLPALLLGAGLFSFIPSSPPSSGPDGVLSAPVRGTQVKHPPKGYTCVEQSGTSTGAVINMGPIGGDGASFADDIRVQGWDASTAPQKIDITFTLSIKVPKTFNPDGTPKTYEAKDSGWLVGKPSVPKEQYKEKDKNGNTGYNYKYGATLTVESSNATGLGCVCYLLTKGGFGLTPEKTMADMEPWVVTTTNVNPGIMGAEHHFENQTGEPLSEIALSLPQSMQSIVNMESTRPGYVILEEGRFVFEPPIEFGEWGDIRWEYDELGPDPDVLTEVLFTPTFLGYVFEPMAATTGPKQKQGRVKILRANGQNQILPPFKIKEYKVGGLPETLVIKCDANMSFVAGTGVAQVLVGDQQVSASPRVQADGKELVLTIGRSKAKIKGEIRLSGLQVKLAKGAFGSARIYVPTGKSWRSVTVGVVR